MPRKYNWVILIVLLTSWPIAALAAEKNALSEHDLLELLAGGVYNARIVQLVQERGITFVPTAGKLDSLRRAGADFTLLNAVKNAQHPTPQLPASAPSPAARLPRRVAKPIPAQHPTPQLPASAPSSIAHLPERIAKPIPARQVTAAEFRRIDGHPDNLRNCRPGHMYLAHDIVGDPQACIKGSLNCCGASSMAAGVSSGMSGAW